MGSRGRLPVLAVADGAATAVLAPASYWASTLYAADTRMAEPAAAPLLPAAAMSLGEAIIEPLAEVEAAVEVAEAAAEEEAEAVAPADAPPSASLWTAPPSPPPPPPSPPLPSPPPPPAEAAVSMDETLQRSSALATLASLAPSTSASLGAVVPGVVPGGATPCSLAAADLTAPAAASAADAPTAAAAVHTKPLVVLVVLGLESSVYPLDSISFRESIGVVACDSTEEPGAPETAPDEPIDFLNRSAHEPAAAGAVLGATAPPGPPAPG